MVVVVADAAATAAAAVAIAAVVVVAAATAAVVAAAATVIVRLAGNPFARNLPATLYTKRLWQKPFAGGASLFFSIKRSSSVINRNEGQKEFKDKRI